MRALLAQGPLRELVVTIMAIIAGHGVVSENLVQILLPLVVAIVAVIQGVAANVGPEKIPSLVRKALSVAPGVAVALGWLTADQAAHWAALIAPLSAVVWSAYFKSIE